MSTEKPNDKPTRTPTPEETRPGRQRDDNIDDLGRRQDGTRVEQSVDASIRDRKSP